MTASTVHPYRLAMHIIMTTYTRRLGFSKLQGSMTHLTIDHLMLTRQGKTSGIMLERIDLTVEMPATRTMTSDAVHSKVITVRGLR